MPKTKGKNPDKVCQLIFLKMYPQQQKQWQLHNTSQYSWMKNLINERFFPNELIFSSIITGSLDMCILKF